MISQKRIHAMPNYDDISAVWFTRRGDLKCNNWENKSLVLIIIDDEFRYYVTF